MLAHINVILNAAKNLSTRLRNLAFARDPSANRLRMTTLVLLFAFILSIFATPAFAQTASPSSTSKESKPTFEVSQAIPTTIPPTSPIYTDLLVHNLFHSFSCLAIGQSIIGQPCLTYQMTRNAQGMIQGIPVLSSINTSGGTMGAVTSLIGAMYKNPPVRTADYLASVGQGLGVVKQAQAQGVTGSGAGVLSPILKLWQVSRNISYVILIIIFLIIGLMVMFRNKINPQTVITAQTALPGLVLGLILITFSYFFAGLISDMAFVGTNLVGYYFSAAQGVSGTDLTSKNLVADVGNKSILEVFSNFIGLTDYSGPISHIVQIIFNHVGTSAQTFIRFATGVMAFQQGEQIGHIVPVIGNLAGTVTGLLATLVAASFVPEIAGFILNWIVIAVLLYSMLKLLLRLVSAYLTIILLTITAPFQLLAAALPGRQGIATGWMLNMLGNILAFPAVLAVLYFVAFLLKSSAAPFNATGNANLIGTSTFPLLGGLTTEFVNFLLAFGALVALPAIPDIINRSVGRAGAAGQLLGQEISGNLRGGRGYSNQWQQFGGGVRQIGQNITEFRGRPLGWSPSEELKMRGIFGSDTRKGLGQGLEIPGAKSRMGDKLYKPNR